MTPLSKKMKREPVTTIRKQATTLSTPTKTPNTKSSILSTPISRDEMPPSSAMKTSFSDRKDPGAILQTLNPCDISVPLKPSDVSPNLSVNFDPKKYSYRPMYQKLSEVSEVLDDQIDQYADIILQAFNLQDDDIGNPSQNTQVQTVVVGRIVCDTLDGGRLNAASVMLETSRRLGTGSRTKLDLSSIDSFALFPGQLVALKGTNGASTFKVSEILPSPSLPPSASNRGDFRKDGTTVIIAAGPYTPNTDLNFEALKVLRDVVTATKPQSVILAGPFIDFAHPLIKSGDFDSTSETLDELFGELITPIIRDFPGLLIVPHINDAISRHPCYPQEALPRAITGLPKFAKLLPNPALFSLDEVSYGISTNDILKHLTMSEISRNPTEKNGLARQSSHILHQRRFYPLFPGPTSEMGSTANLDMGFAGLTEFGNALPDILISPSEMTTIVKVVEGVIVINPGGLSKRAGAGSYAKLYIEPKSSGESLVDGVDAKMEDVDALELHEVWKRARVDIVRI